MKRKIKEKERSAIGMCMRIIADITELGETAIFGFCGG